MERPTTYLSAWRNAESLNGAWAVHHELLSRLLPGIAAVGGAEIITLNAFLISRWRMCYCRAQYEFMRPRHVRRF